MLSSVSWSEYIAFFTVVTAIYYTVLATTCYRKEISNRFLRRSYQPKYRTDISIPIENGVMGSVVFDGPDGPPMPVAGYASQPAIKEDLATDDGEEEDGPLFDEYESEAEQATKMDLVEDLVSRFTAVIDNARRSITVDELVEELHMFQTKRTRRLFQFSRNLLLRT